MIPRPTVAISRTLAATLKRSSGGRFPVHIRTFSSALPESTRPQVYYQGPTVPTSIWSTGQVGTIRDSLGSDNDFFGVDPTPTEVEVQNGRGRGFTLDANGFALVQDPLRHVDYYNQDEVVGTYYKECEALVCRETGAKFAVAFDHNNRAMRRKLAGENIVGGNAVQEPLIGYGVHNDYTARSAPARIRQMVESQKHNDTVKWDKPPIDAGSVDTLMRGRWVFVNVWRNVTTIPIKSFPLGLMDASCMSVDDLVVFEIRYRDRTGENYFARYSPKHQWFYFPELTRDEAVLIKCWDSRGKDFIEFMPGIDASSPNTVLSSVPTTFSLHTGFEDPATPETAPDRESIEVRTVAFFEDP